MEPLPANKTIETMKTQKILLAALLSSLALTTVACYPALDSDGVVPTAGRYSPEKEARLLSFLNDQVETTLHRLDVDCELRVDAASNLILHRDGGDQLAGTDDDDLFDDIVEIDTVGGIGPTSLERLLTCAEWYAPVLTPTPDRIDVVTELEGLDPLLAELITGELQDEAARRADPALDAPVVFEAVSIHSAKGVVLRYEVDYLQGESLRIRLTLDADLELIPSDDLG